MNNMRLTYFLVYFPEPRRPSRVIFWRGFNPSPSRNMAASSSGGVLKDLVHPNFSETVKSHNNVSFKLVKTGKCFVVKNLIAVSC